MRLIVLCFLLLTFGSPAAFAQQVRWKPVEIDLNHDGVRERFSLARGASGLVDLTVTGTGGADIHVKGFGWIARGQVPVQLGVANGHLWVVFRSPTAAVAQWKQLARIEFYQGAYHVTYESVDWSNREKPDERGYCRHDYWLMQGSYFYAPEGRRAFRLSTPAKRLEDWSYKAFDKMEGC